MKNEQEGKNMDEIKGHSKGVNADMDSEMDSKVRTLEQQVESLERKMDAMHKAMDVAGTAFDMIAKTFLSQQKTLEEIMKDILAVEIRTDMLAREAGMEFDEDTVEKIHEEADRTFEESMTEAREMAGQMDEEQDSESESDAVTQVVRLDPVKMRELKKILGIDADGDDDTDDSDDTMWKLTERMMN